MDKAIKAETPKGSSHASAKKAKREAERDEDEPPRKKAMKPVAGQEVNVAAKASESPKADSAEEQTQGETLLLVQL